MKTPSPHRKPLVLALMLAFASTLTLSACGGGGGGGNVRPDPPPPPPPPPPQLCTDPNAENDGGPLPCVYRQNGTWDNLLVPSNADLAHAQGFTGKGVKIGILDSYWFRDYAPLLGRVDYYNGPTTPPDPNYPAPEGTEDEAVYYYTADIIHGTTVATVAAGAPVGEFRGGIAPDARIYMGQVCDNQEGVFERGGCGFFIREPGSNRFRNMIDIMAPMGVRLFNTSFGGDGVDLADVPPPQPGSIYSRVLGNLIAYDALVIGALGNDGKENPDPDGHVMLPYHDPEFYDHIISVAAVHSVGSSSADWSSAVSNDYLAGSINSDTGRWEYPDGYHVFLAEYSNQCGLTAQWCVSAATNTQAPKIPGVDGDGGIHAGTSHATPVVTGVAALVMEAYPWMSASNIQQTVLTTATDIGAPGVDPIYGWGLVNARKAIDGPAQFVRNDYIEGFIADFEGESRPFFNDISGDGWLWKLGRGTLTLAGNNTYTGATVVEQGTLRVTGALGSDVEVAPGATFATGGSGATINGHFDVYNPANWNDGLPISRHRFGAATVAIQLGAPLTVTGEVVIDQGNRLLLLPEADGYTVRSTETLISTGGGLFGTFSDARAASGFFWDAALNYGTHTLTADLTRTSAQAQALALGAPANVVAGAAMADALISHTDHLVESGQTAGNESLINATAKLISAANDDIAALSLASLTGDVHAAARHLGIQRTLGDGERLADRLRTLGSRTEHGFWMQNDTGNGYLGRIGYGQAEVRHSTSGFGMDERVGDAWTLGFSAARSRSNAHLDALGGRLTGSGQQMALYARRDLGQTGYFSGLASFDRHTVDTRRQVLTGNAVSSVIGQHTDGATLVRLETGLRLSGGLTPYLAAGSVSLRQGGFTETGVLGLNADADTFTRTFADLGTRFERNSGNWSFTGTLSARQMFGGRSSFNAAFNGAEAVRFAVPGQSLARSSVRFGSDLSYRTGNGWNYSLGLGADHASGQRSNAWGEATINFGF